MNNKTRDTNSFVIAVIVIISVGFVLSNIILDKGNENLPSGYAIKQNAVLKNRCSDRIDNDGDGLIDYPNDPGCSSKSDTTETSPSLICDNGLDELNDADTLADYRLSGGDPGCISVTDTSEIDGFCDNLIDDDNDTKIDFSNIGDSKCDSFSDPDEKPKDNCKDNDLLNHFYRGQVAGYDNDLQFVYTDFCIDAINLNEYYCGMKVDDYDPLSQRVDCKQYDNGSTKYVCSNGACMLSPTCGNNVCEAGETCSSCPIDCGQCSTECNDGKDNDNDTKIDFNVTGDSKCDSSLDNDENPRDNCKDTDNGINKNIRGTASGDDNDLPFSFTDFCIDTKNLNEYYCGDKSNDYDPLNTMIDCGVGNGTGPTCSNGACI